MIKTHDEKKDKMRIYQNIGEHFGVVHPSDPLSYIDNIK